MEDANDRQPRGVSLSSVEDVQYEELQLSDDLAWLRYRIGKFVAGGLYLLAGEPGIGKSTLAIQMALDLSRFDISTLYILTEQSEGELKRRAQQIGCGMSARELDKALDLIHPEDGIYEMNSLPEFFSREVLSQNGRHHGVKFIVVDSIHGQGMSSTASQQYKEIYKFGHSCKAEGITTFLVGHVTKKGGIAGPKSLEHNVDCILYMKKAFVYRPLFVPKNRYGPAIFKPIPLELDKDTTALRLSPLSRTEGAIARTYMGRPYGFAEAQAAVSLPKYGTRGQITAPGLPPKEIDRLLHAINQVEEIDLADLSYSIQCNLPGDRRYNRLVDLPLAVALISSYLQRAIPDNYFYLGEIDLLTKVRNVREDLLLELWEALSEVVPLDAGKPSSVFCSLEAAETVGNDLDSRVKLIGCRRLEDAVYGTWPDLRPDAAQEVR